jgi:MFS family permease
MFVWYAVQVHQTKYLIDDGFSPEIAAWALGLVSLVAVPGQIALGHLSDRIGREWVWMIGNGGFALCCLTLIALDGHPVPALLYVMVTTQGALGYGLTSVMGAITAEIFQGQHYGSIFGAAITAAVLGGAAGPWIAGVLHDWSGSYAPAFWLSFALSLGSVAAIWLAAPRKVRNVSSRVGGVTAN